MLLNNYTNVVSNNYYKHYNVSLTLLIIIIIVINIVNIVYNN